MPLNITIKYDTVLITKRFLLIFNFKLSFINLQVKWLLLITNSISRER